jgi:lysyl-tRNA synthetase, class II
MSDDNEIIRIRREKLAVLRARGNAFPNDFRRDAYADDLQRAHGETEREALATQGIRVRVAGRIMLRRVMGKASFFTLQDVSGRIQCYVRGNDIGDAAYADFNELWDIGDIVGVAGTLFRTNKGELTVQAAEIRMLTKAVRPLPEKFHGLTDQELRYRQRYLDLIMNEETRASFRMRSAIVGALRRFFVERGFLEVETPMMHPIPGGATARPFVTYHNALGMDLYLRVAPELYLKRLVVGGFERVFEINRSFRNEGLSTRHNPEFTMLEFYQAFADSNDLMDITEELMRSLCQEVLGATTLDVQGQTIDFGKPIPRLSMVEVTALHTGYPVAELEDADRLRGILTTRNEPIEAHASLAVMQLALFESCVEERLVEPVFVTGYPSEVSPLARRSDSDPDVAERFELFVGGREIANGFSELNDPEDQAARFQAQAQRKSEGDLEAMHFDHDYIAALEHGLPPTAGEGIGVDRLVMLLTGATSIRDVLLFPHMRPREH